MIVYLLADCMNAQTMVEKTWGNRGFNGAYSVAATNDGGYILAGLSQNFGGDSVGNIIIIKTNSSCDTQWTFQFAGPQHKLQGGNDVMQTKDGGYMITGHTEGFGAGECDAYCMKLDRNGNKLWFKTYGGVLDDVSQSIVELADGSFVFAGKTANYGAARFNIYIVKVSAEGDSIWQKTYGGSGLNYSFGIAQARHGGGFLVVGSTTSFGAGGEDGYVLRLDDNGNTLWTRTYGGPGNDRLYDVRWTLDGGYILAGGRAANATSTKANGWFIKFDSMCNFQWQKLYGGIGYEAFLSINQLPNGNFIASGISENEDTLGKVFTEMTDSAGTEIYTGNYGPSGSYSRSIASQGISGYMVVGSTKPNLVTTGDLYYLEIMSVTGIAPVATNRSLNVYPVPAFNTEIFEIPASFASSPYKMELFNANGQLMKTIQNEPGTEIPVQIQAWAPGLYLYRFTTEGGSVFRGKFEVK